MGVLQVLFVWILSVPEAQHLTCMNEVDWFISQPVSFVLTSVSVFSVPVTDPVTPYHLNPTTASNVQMWRMSSLSSIMTTPTHRRTTSTASVVRPAAPTKAQPTPSLLQGTSAKPASWFVFWRRPDRPSIPNYCSWLILDVEEAEEVRDTSCWIRLLCTLYGS